ncbi:inositol-tetrakisphosphate 1-kinase isoform X4 [Columba livia]|uniref:inositol-tetrakisphosphate 1-kinase isoform X4 n=1 Tax=Columba livia TaxID=8932 RepID=UPI0031BB5395
MPFGRLPPGGPRAGGAGWCPPGSPLRARGDAAELVRLPLTWAAAALREARSVRVGGTGTAAPLNFCLLLAKGSQVFPVKSSYLGSLRTLRRKRGVEVVQLDLTKPIEDQGPLDVIIHKLTDVILEADQNDSQSLELVQRFQEYIDAHPETIILDPLPAIRTLLDRSKSYELIRQIEAYMQDERICSPPFMELTSACGEDTLQLIEKKGLAFPFICKTRVAHGTNSHEMAIIFNQEGLKAVRPPCVIQSFINHNAVLYKVFVVGESYTVVKRPSLKNFSAGISGYEGVSEFFTDLLNHIAAVLQGQVPEVTQLNRSKLLAEQTSGIMDERICCTSTGCLSVMGKDSSWIVESETNSSVKLQHQRLGCNSAVSPSFQQHCVATLATKASSQ